MAAVCRIVSGKLEKKNDELSRYYITSKNSINIIKFKITLYKRNYVRSKKSTTKGGNIKCSNYGIF